MKSLRSSFVFILLVASFGLPLSAQDFQIESFQGLDVASGEIIVRFRGATQLQSQTLAMRDADILSAEPVGRSGALRLRSRNRNAASLLQAYNARLDVLYAEPNYVGQYFDLPNDASLGQQWGIRNTGQVIGFQTGTAGADVKATQAWDITEGSRSIVVGVVDSGVDYTHPDLAANMWSAPTAFTVTINGETITCAAGTHGFSSRTRTCDPLDDYGHGTHVAGIIGAAGNNGIGVAGVSRIANMMALKLGALGTFTTLDVIATLDFVMQVKALFPSEADIRVLNASWGQPFSQALRDEIDLLNTQGILFVASAGNAASNNDLVASYPATFDSPNIISVAATDNRDALASFSSWGPTTVDLGAPGVNVLSTMMSGNYGLLSGTSMSSPMVAGAAALVLSACPMSTPALKDNLLNSADEVPALAQRTFTGGRLNVFRALEACAGSPAPTFTFTVSPGTQNVDLPGSTTLTVTSTALGGFSSAVHLSVSGLPVGMSATFGPPPVIPGGSGSATLTIAADATVPVGTYAIGITGTSGPIERRAGVVINAGPFATPISLGQTILGVLPPNRNRPDFYALTLASATLVTIDMKSVIFDNFLTVRSASGTILFSDSGTGGNLNARVTASLGAGTYLIEATSSDLDGAGGRYSLSINTPTITSFTPLLAQPGATINVTLSGTRFVSPMTIDAGTDITVSNVNVTSPTSATATFTIAANAVPGPRDLTVTTSDGISNPMMYPIPTRIDPGQKISGSLAVTDLAWPNNPFRYYSDLYLLTIDSSTQGPVTIEVISTTDFDSVVFFYPASGGVIQLVSGVLSTTLSAGTYFIEVTSPLPQLGSYVLSVHLPGLTAINPRFVEQGASVPVTFTGSRFVSPMTVDAGDNIVAGAVTVNSSTSATATLNISAAAAPGIRNVTIATPQGTSNAVPLRVFRPIPSIDLGETISGTLAPADLPSLLTPGPNVDLHYTHLYRFTLAAASTRVTVTLQSTDFDPFLYIVGGPTGVTLASNNDSAGDHNSRITTTLAAGTYYLDVTSFLERGEGDYTISLDPVGFGLTGIIPRFGGQGSTFTVSLNGVGFVAPMTIDAGPDISVTNVTVVSATLATATFTIAAGAATGVRDVTATTPQGTTTLPFAVYEIPSINLGETKSGTLSIIDRASPNRPGSYGDLYRFVLSSPMPVAIDLKSTDFNGFVYLLSASGLPMASDDSSGGGTDARIAANLAAGTYFIDATSATAGLGNYTISTAFNPPTLYFPRVLAPSDLPLTGFAITNPGGVDATVTFTMYDVAGLVVATSNETIPARAQFAKLAVDIFPTASRPGWVQAKSDVAGVKGFWLGGDWANVVDGAESAPEQPPSVDLVFPMVTPPTELNVVNLGSGANIVAIGLFGADGALLVPSTTRSIPANGAFKSTVAAIFPSANLANAYSLRVVGNQRLAGTTVASNYPAGPSWIVMNGANSAITPTQANFPQVVSGQSWNSILWVSSLLNVPVPQTLTLTFTPVTGSPLPPVTRTLTGVRASLRESVESLFGLSGYQEGWVRVTGTAPLAAFLTYGFGTASAVDQGQSTSRTSMIFSHVANGPGWSTGLALLNPSTTTDANVQVYVMRKEGNLVGSASFVLPRGTKVARHLSELVPASTANDGFVFVRTTNNVALFGFQVFFSRDLSVFANIPAAGLDPGITFVPPTQ